jgi:hypothetical protein
MTNHQSPVTPPPELRRLWAQQAQRIDLHDPVAWMQYVSEKAAQWGADQELEACCELMDRDFMAGPSDLRAARRPKPPSLKEQALLAIDTAVADDRLSADVANVVRRALEQIDD